MSAKKINRVTAVLIISGLSSNVIAANLNNFVVSGDQRAGWVSYDYDNPNGDPTINKGHKDSEGFYVIPKISIQTPHNNGFNAKITLAGATDFGINDEGKQSRNLVFDPIENKSFAILQELYLEYNNNTHNALIGRNEAETPMVNFDDYYMLGNSFEVIKYTNTSLQHHRLHAGFFNKMAGVWDHGANGTEFHTMSDASSVPQVNKDEANGKGVYYVAAEYTAGKHHGQVWEYYAQDLYNMLFGQYNFKSGNSEYNYDFGLQFINWSQVGKLKASATEINYSLYSLKYDGYLDNGFSFATGFAKYTDGPGTGSTLGAWGGYPFFANGLIYHFFEAGDLRNAASYKVQGGYDLSKLGIDNTDILIRYTLYDLDPTYSISSAGIAQDSMDLIGFQLSFTFMNTGYFKAVYERRKVEKEHPAVAIWLIGGYKF